MKKTLIALSITLAAGAACADPLARLVNDAGGEIILTDHAGVCVGGRLKVISTSRKGPIVNGCWESIDKYVSVIWDDGRETAYLATDFTLDAAYKAPAPVKNGI